MCFLMPLIFIYGLCNTAASRLDNVALNAGMIFSE
jgi:hypothetical protein